MDERSDDQNEDDRKREETLERFCFLRDKLGDFAVSIRPAYAMVQEALETMDHLIDSMQTRNHAAAAELSGIIAKLLPAIIPQLQTMAAVTQSMSGLGEDLSQMKWVETAENCVAPAPSKHAPVVMSSRSRLKPCVST